MANPIRRAAVAGSWYPASAEALAAAVDGYIAAADEGPRPAQRLESGDMAAQNGLQVLVRDEAAPHHAAVTEHQ